MGPPPDERQLKRRPTECPHCNAPIKDRYSWETDDRLYIDVGCGTCDWYAYIIAEVVPPDAE